MQSFRDLSWAAHYYLEKKQEWSFYYVLKFIKYNFGHQFTPQYKNSIKYKVTQLGVNSSEKSLKRDGYTTNQILHNLNERISSFAPFLLG